MMNARRSFQVLASGLLALAVSTAALRAQPADCSDGIHYDDGVFENGSGLNPATAARGSYVTLFTPTSTPSQLQSVCVCWVRTGSDTSLTFALNVWAADGTNGAPGTLIQRVTGLQVANVSTSLATGFSRVELASQGITVNGPVFIGPDWNTQTDTSFFLCDDESAGTAVRPIYLCATATDSPCKPALSLTGGNNPVRALGVRAKFGTAAPGCMPSDTTLCLDDQPGDRRFKVEVAYQTTQGGGQSGSGHAISLAPLGVNAGGLVWFFSSGNPEMLIKVLNACSIPGGKYWVFYSAGTNVGLTTTVTDTKTGAFKVYTNPDRTAAPPVQDTNAFPCT